MTLYKNLNDIPFQFRQYEQKKSNIESEYAKQNISSEKNDKETEIQNKTLDNTTDTKEKKEAKITSQNSNCQISVKDKIFIFLILAIFFDAL